MTNTPNLNLERLPANTLNWSRQMNNNMTLIDATVGAYFAIQNLQGVWKNSTNYNAGDAIVDDTSSEVYIANVTHISGAVPLTFEQDRALHPTYWSPYSTSAAFRGSWLPNTNYTAGQFVVNGPKYAVALTTHTSSASFDADVIAGRWAVLIDLSAVGIAVLPVPGGAPDANKFVVINPEGSGYTIVLPDEALILLGVTSIGQALFTATSQEAARNAIGAEEAGSYQPLTNTLTQYSAAGVGATGQQLVTDGAAFTWLGGVAYVATRADLLALTVRPTSVVMGGYYAAGDAGTGTFRWFPGDTTTPIQGMIEQPTTGAPGRYRRLVSGSELHIAWTGGRGDLSASGSGATGTCNGTDNTVCLQALYTYLRLGSAAIYNQSATIRFGAGRYGFTPMTSDIRAVKHVGNGLQGTYLCALNQAQTHVFEFNFAGVSACTFEDCRVLGWIHTGAAAEINWPDYGIIYSGGTSTTRGRMIMDSCKTCLWIKAGTNDYINEILFLGFNVAAIRLGGISSTGNSTVSETRITNCKMYSSAAAGTVIGIAILQDSDSGALVVENTDGGSLENFLKITDSLGGLNAGDFVHLAGCTTGECNTGIYIDVAGVSFEAVGCRISANKGPGSYGVFMASATCSPVFIGCDFHNCEQVAVRINDGVALTMIACYIYDIGNSGTLLGIGVECAGGAAEIRLKGCIFNGKHGNVPSRPDMKYCVSMGAAFTGTCYVDGDTELIAHTQDLHKAVGSTGKYYAQRRSITIPDDTVFALDLIPGASTFGGDMFAFASSGNPSAAASPSFIVMARANVMTAAAFLGSTNATNLTAPATGAVPTGTTGPDGGLNLYSNADGVLYIENRLGASKTWSVNRMSQLYGYV